MRSSALLVSLCLVAAACVAAADPATDLRAQEHAAIRQVIVSHCHNDHFGGARHLQATGSMTVAAGIESATGAGTAQDSRILRASGPMRPRRSANGRAC
jgi:glyoxylase-like metal-dependent hydrolase (beta-lactamase superfamily II)